MKKTLKTSNPTHKLIPGVPNPVSNNTTCPIHIQLLRDMIIQIDPNASFISNNNSDCNYQKQKSGSNKIYIIMTDDSYDVSDTEPSSGNYITLQSTLTTDIVNYLIVAENVCMKELSTCTPCSPIQSIFKNIYFWIPVGLCVILFILLMRLR